jgi:hypothetical protein
VSDLLNEAFVPSLCCTFIPKKKKKDTRDKSYNLRYPQQPIDLLNGIRPNSALLLLSSLSLLLLLVHVAAELEHSNKELKFLLTLQCYK